MFGHDFYHGTLRKYVILFGNMFNEIQIKRFDNSGNKIQTVNVPIAYGPKQKWVERALGDPTALRSVNVVLPRMSFAMTTMTYAPTRKLNSTLKFKNAYDANKKLNSSMYAPVPYDINFTLSILTKNAEDGIQIVEQIVPFFTPDYTVTMKALPDMDLKLDVPIELNTISSDDSYEGDYDSPRILTWDLDFTIKGYLFGPVVKDRYINDIQVTSYFDDGFDNYTSAGTQVFTGNTNFGSSNTIV